jgi:deoxyribodipyrimidine photo-lyase
MTALALFPPTLEAARARIAAVRPADYARSRNALEGAVTRLSPYITHGLVSLPQVLAGVAARYRLDVQHKFVFELGWREYFRHVWQHRGEYILHSLHDGPLPESAYTREMPADIRQARTGVPAIDQAVRALYATGYLHNHARMWLASYVVHLRKVHWRAGADWMVAHLLDGDLASNHLSWQWVAGTGSHKPYLFNADNVARYAPSAWHSAGSVLDTSYEALDAIARSPWPVPVRPLGEGVDEPPLSSQPSHGTAGTAPQAADVAGRDVWLIHPWALGQPPADLPAGCLHVAWWPAEHHAAWPWGAARWRFVGTRLSALATLQWQGSRSHLAQALATARSVHTQADAHVGAGLPPGVKARPAPRLFADIDRPCASFSTWWNRATRGLTRLSDLPGLQALVEQDPAEPLFGPAAAMPSPPLPEDGAACSKRMSA